MLDELSGYKYLKKIMDDKFLYYDEIPKGIKTIYFNGKRITREEFLIKKNKFVNKKNEAKASS